MKKPDWKQFQDLIAEKFRSICKYGRSTKGSGNSGEIADLTNDYLTIECKDENKVNVFQEKYMQKIIDETPLHSDRIPVLFTRNKDRKIRAHLDGDDFIEIFIEYIILKYGESEWDL